MQDQSAGRLSADEDQLPGLQTAVSSVSSREGESSLDFYKCTNSICKGSTPMS